MTQMAIAHLRASLPKLVLIGGLPGAGKSTVAERLGFERGWRVISSDVVRKELAGIAVGGHAPAEWQHGIYSPDMTTETYGVMLDRAKEALQLGESVILDASWSDQFMRARAKDLANETMSNFVQILCVANTSIARERLISRLLEGTSPSDADTAIARRMTQVADPWPDAHVVNTSGTVDEALADLRVAVDGWPIRPEVHA